jgi:hypothetical protein
MSGTQSVSNNIYYSVVGGEFRTKSTQDHPKAMSRVNKKGVTVWEIPHRAVFGKIENVAIYDGTLGKQINITLDPDEDGKTPVLSFQVESKNGREIMERLPSVNLNEEVRFFPYKFVPEGETEERSGISLHQKDEAGKFTVKVESHFYSDKKPLHGVPTLDWDKATESEKKIYGIQKTEFLLNYFTANVLPKFHGETKATKSEYPEEEINPEDIPF